MGEMCSTCKNVMGVLVLLAGLSLLGFGLGYLNGATAHLAAGGLLTLAGLGKLVHGMNMCPSCAGPSKK